MSHKRDGKMKTVRIPYFAPGDFDRVRFIARLRKVLNIGLRDAVERVDAQEQITIPEGTELDEWFDE